MKRPEYIEGIYRRAGGPHNVASITPVCLSNVGRNNWGCATSRAFREAALAVVAGQNLSSLLGGARRLGSGVRVSVVPTGLGSPWRVTPR
jgi:hypothetical protein